MHSEPLEASPWIRRFAPLVPAGGEVLDLACGSGRHARLLAGLGHRVEAVDRDAAALARLSGIVGISVRVADLEHGPWPYAGRRFAGIVVANYLHRPLLPLIEGALADGGVLIYETFMEGNARFGRPSNPDFLLRSQELLQLAQAAGLRVLAYEEGETMQPRPAVVQRLCATRGAGAMPAGGGPAFPVF
ncbi:MAG: methyltransferase domain-containing protein [Azospira sp.]|jgi:SAM-dependent methyltransferase|nr:methyltransferase domain-containing protein [Azospira sp.]